MNEGGNIAWLAEFARQVRESTLKRLAQVRPEDRGWSPGEGIMSFADTLRHLIEVDRWLLDRLDGKTEADVQPCPGAGGGLDWQAAMAEFRQLGQRRQERILGYSSADLTAVSFAAAPGDGGPAGGAAAGMGTPLWMLLLRRGLDHEIHHRGELQLMLMLRYGA